MTKNQYKLHRLRGDISVLDEHSRTMIALFADQLRHLVDESGEDSNLVFVAMALVSAESLNKPEPQPNNLMMR